MDKRYKELGEKLSKANIRPSHQRIVILDYLESNQCHPTVDHIFNDIKLKLPTLSKSTVYNILNLFVDSGILKTVVGEEHEARYDIVIKSHGHFKCNICNLLYNFDIDMERLPACGLEDFLVIDKNIYFKGICPKCLSNKNKAKEERT